MLYANPNKKREADISRIEKRAEFIKECLQMVEDKKLIFKFKKHLLSYVAMFIEKSERHLLSSQKSLAVAPRVRSVTVGGLYKSKTYSALIDNWIADNPKSILHVTNKDNSAEAKLRLQCVMLSNQCERLKVDLQQASLQMLEYENPTQKSLSTVSQESLMHAYLVIDSLLDEFNGFLKIDSVGVILDNVLRRKIIDIEVIQGYLDWKKSVVQIN